MYTRQDDDKLLSDINSALYNDEYGTELALHFFEALIDNINFGISRDNAGKIICSLVKDKKFDIVREILKHCPDINTLAIDTNGNSAWHYTVFNDDDATLLCLLNYGQNGLLTLNPYTYRTPLSISLKNKQFGLAKLMLHNFLLSQNMTSDEAGELIFDLAREQEEDWAIRVINAGINNIYINYTDAETGNSAFHYAVIHKQKRLLPMLFDLKYDEQLLINKNGNTACDIAFDDKSYDLVNLMLKKDIYLIDALNRNQLGEMLLYYTKIKDHTNAYLIVMGKKSFNTSCVDESGNTCLHYSVSNNYTYIALRICEKNLDLITRLNKAGQSPVSIAITNGNLEFALSMAELMHDGYMKNNFFSKIILLAMTNGLYDIVEKILKQSSSSYFCYEPGTKNSLLHLAALHNHEKIADKLFTLLGTTNNIKNKNQETPLDLALRLKHYSVVKVILAHSASQLPHLQTNNILEMLINLNEVHALYLLCISWQLNDDQIKFFVYKCINNKKEVIDIIESAEQINSSKIVCRNDEAAGEIVNKIAKNRILRIALQNHVQSAAILNNIRVKNFISQHNPESIKLFTFFYNTKSANISQKILDNELNEAEELLLKEESYVRQEINLATQPVYQSLIIERNSYQLEKSTNGKLSF